ncbi:DgyrCDS5808 [Dimorphilus gyrociliatus]|uniref:DgyrCDS5808 n=1 Tax=Dimorphilus gyrociliatus TaxID=2664684 RepID=A0A7I8VL50_9ANNE|nr:DgyrCDS5808 [Dimorphilus gyrociliatus]
MKENGEQISIPADLTHVRNKLDATRTSLTPKAHRTLAGRINTTSVQVPAAHQSLPLNAQRRLLIYKLKRREENDNEITEAIKDCVCESGMKSSRVHSAAEWFDKRPKIIEQTKENDFQRKQIDQQTQPHIRFEPKLEQFV